MPICRKQPNFRSRLERCARTRDSTLGIVIELESSSRQNRLTTSLGASSAIGMEVRKAVSTLLPRLRVAQRTLSTSSRNHALPLPTATSTTSAIENSKIPDRQKPLLDWADKVSRKPLGRISTPGRTKSKEGNSADMILNALNKRRPSPSAKFDIHRMADPKREHDVANIMQSLNETVAAPVAAKQKLRLTPSTGRTITVGAGQDLLRSLRLLEQSCARNRVRADFTKQRFHERGGLKRKRLVRERWRKHFMKGFKQAVDRVKHLKKQGW